MNMVERVARALAKADRIEICSDASYEFSSYGPKARAAIEAMREPTEQQLAAAWAVITAEKQGQGITRLTPGLGAREIYQAMIDAADLPSHDRRSFGGRSWLDGQQSKTASKSPPDARQTRFGYKKVSD